MSSSAGDLVDDNENNDNDDDDDESSSSDWENSIETSDLDSTDESCPENDMEVNTLLLFFNIIYNFRFVLISGYLHSNTRTFTLYNKF